MCRKFYNRDRKRLLRGHTFSAHTSWRRLTRAGELGSPAPIQRLCIAVAITCLQSRVPDTLKRPESPQTAMDRFSISEVRQPRRDFGYGGTIEDRRNDSSSDPRLHGISRLAAMAAGKRVPDGA
ncbi:hypothetical protein MTX20_03380 [Bradyrhizobium sp. ISRA435]|nr:hypothetical protein MTX20_03380 [Bradyrhizobium sp. ISRA435]